MRIGLLIELACTARDPGATMDEPCMRGSSESRFSGNDTGLSGLH